MNAGDEELPAFMALLHGRLLLYHVLFLLLTIPSEQVRLTKTQGDTSNSVRHALSVRKPAQDGLILC